MKFPLHPTPGCNALGIIGEPISTNPAITAAIGRPDRFEFWRDHLEAPEDVLSIVSQGYRIPFKNGRHPPSSH